MVNYKWCVSAGKLEHNFLDAAFMDITLICNQWEIKEEAKLSWELRLWKLCDFFPDYGDHVPGNQHKQIQQGWGCAGI